MSKCQKCYFADQCDSPRCCDGYTNIDCEMDDDEIYNLTEREKKEYYEAWLAYIQEDDDFF